jgi:hypothetical protein
VAADARITYDFGPSGVTKAHIGSVENYVHYFPKGSGRAPGTELVPEPRVNEAVAFEDFFYCWAPHATPSGTCGHSVQISSSILLFDAECKHSDWEIYLGGLFLQMPSNYRCILSTL